MSNKREVFGWMMYDWANSSFSVIVASTFLGPYLISLAEADNGFFDLFGWQIRASAFFSICVGLSVFLQVLFLPVLGSIADYSHLKKKMMFTFAYSGAVATMLLFLVQKDLIFLGGLLFIIANLSFGAALVFYNAFLPDIAGPDQRDSVSSRGFALGYLGGGILLLLNLFLINSMEDTGLAMRISLGGAGVWWIVFAYLFPQQRLVQRQPAQMLPPGESYLSHSLKQLSTTLREMKDKYPATLRYLIAYLIYNDGIQTINIASSLFATEELGIPIETLILVILMIQFVAAIGAYLFSLLAARVGAKKSIMFSLVIWVSLVVYAYAFLYTEVQFWILGAILALVLGGSQALSRSLFSQMIPQNREAEYFSFYEISERGTSWLGPIIFGLVSQFSGTQRLAIISLIIFFAVGLVILYFTDVRKAIAEAGNELPTVV